MNCNSTYKYCLVLCCSNSTASTPEKIFFHVPKDAAKRKAWTTAMNTDILNLVATALIDWII